MIQNLLAPLLSTVSGKLIDTVKEYFPPEMTEEKRRELELELRLAAVDAEREAHVQAMEAQRELDKRIAEQEGTASDLLNLPYLGRLMLFVRGCQRPIWCGVTLYLDILWFNGDLSDLNDKQESVLYVINVLVLGFLFGERALKNVIPSIGNIFKK